MSGLLSKFFIRNDSGILPELHTKKINIYKNTLLYTNVKKLRKINSKKIMNSFEIKLLGAVIILYFFLNRLGLDMIKAMLVSLFLIILYLLFSSKNHY